MDRDLENNDEARSEGAENEVAGSNPAAESPVSLESWQTSPFAIGRSKLTWREDRKSPLNDDSNFPSRLPPWNVICTAYVCPCTGRIGNMIVFYQRTAREKMEDGTVVERPRPICMLGPYWMVLFGLTIPLCAFVSAWTTFTRYDKVSLVVQIFWLLITAGLFISLLNVAFRNPGILYRHAEIPAGEDELDWRWNDQAHTYRPATAKYDTDCGLVVEEFDHTCPWTGTAIGRNNMCWFRLFLLFLACALVLNVVVLVMI